MADEESDAKTLGLVVDHAVSITLEPQPLPFRPTFARAAAARETETPRNASPEPQDIMATARAKILLRPTADAR